MLQTHLDDDMGLGTGRLSPASSITSSHEQSSVYPCGKVTKKRSTSAGGLKTLGRLFNKKGKSSMRGGSNYDQG